MNKAFCVLAAALLTAYPPVYSEAAGKSRHLSPLEQLVTETLAWDQFDGLIKTGSASVSKNSQILFRSGKSLEKAFLDNPKEAESDLKASPVVIYTEINSVGEIHGHKLLKIKRPQINLTLEMSDTADSEEINRSALPGRRYAFYCKFSSYKNQTIAFNNCRPIDQYLHDSRKKMLALIDDFLNGRKSNDPELPHFAMLAYMGIVSSKLLPKHSVCRQIAYDGDWTYADIRLCSKDVGELWSNVQDAEKFNEVLDAVEDNLKKHGVDVALLQEAFVAQD